MSENLISVKDYAEQTKRSVQGVYQQINRSCNEEALKGHVLIKEVDGKKIKMLDETAVNILNEGRGHVPAVVMSNNNLAVIEDLREKQNELTAVIIQYQEKMENLQNKINDLNADLQKSKDEVNATQKELNETQKELHKSQMDLQKERHYKEEEINYEQKKCQSMTEEVINEKDERICKLSASIAKLETELEFEKNRKLTFRERLFGKTIDK